MLQYKNQEGKIIRLEQTNRIALFSKKESIINYTPPVNNTFLSQTEVEKIEGFEELVVKKVYKTKIDNKLRTFSNYILCSLEEKNLYRVLGILEKTKTDFKKEKTNNLFDKVGIYRFFIDGDEQEICKICETLQDEKLVKFAHPDFIAEIDPCANYLDKQWALDANRGLLYNPKINEAKEILKQKKIDTSRVKIAIIDNGCYNHDDYKNVVNVSLAFNTQNNNAVVTPAGQKLTHGTSVIGIIGSIANSIDNFGIEGVITTQGIEQNIIPISIGTYNTTNISCIVAAIDKAIEIGAKIINLSLSCAEEDSIKQAMDRAISNNIVVVCAAGNLKQKILLFPAKYKHTQDAIIAVGGCDKEGKVVEKVKERNLANSSNLIEWSSVFGKALDIIAPASQIISTINNDKHEMFYGTSAAAPHISAVAAMILAINNALTPLQIKEIICTSGNKKISNYDAEKHGNYGLLDGEAAIKAALDTLFIS